MWSVRNIIFWISVLYETVNVDGGYSYPNPSSPSHPHVYHTYQEVHHEQFVPSISYSLSQNDYNYLRGQKNSHLNDGNHHQSYNDYNQNLQQTQHQHGQIQPVYNQHADNHHEHQTVHYEYAQRQHGQVQPGCNQHADNHHEHQSVHYEHAQRQHGQVQPGYSQHADNHDEHQTIHYEYAQRQHGQVQPGYNQHADTHQEHQSVHYEYAQHQHPAYNQYIQNHQPNEHQYNEQSQNHQPIYEQHTQVYDQPVYNQHVQHHDSANHDYTSTNPAEYNEQSAVIKKHIYFHLPPPDLEKPQNQIVQNILPPKKTYKIIFIKVPAQESKNHVLLQRLNSIQDHVEEKTLIYVLVKKPEVSNVVVPNVPPTVQSKPEVFYVKYKQNPAQQIASQVNVGLAGDLANSVSGLLPGLVNGQTVIRG